MTGSEGLFYVLGSHSYTMSGTFRIQVTISQGWGVQYTNLFVGDFASEETTAPTKPPTVHVVWVEGTSTMANLETGICRMQLLTH